MLNPNYYPSSYEMKPLNHAEFFYQTNANRYYNHNVNWRYIYNNPASQILYPITGPQIDFLNPYGSYQWYPGYTPVTIPYSMTPPTSHYPPLTQPINMIPGSYGGGYPPFVSSGGYGSGSSMGPITTSSTQVVFPPSPFSQGGPSTCTTPGGCHNPIPPQPDFIISIPPGSDVGFAGGQM